MGWFKNGSNQILPNSLAALAELLNKFFLPCLTGNLGSQFQKGNGGSHRFQPSDCAPEAVGQLQVSGILVYTAADEEGGSKRPKKIITLRSGSRKRGRQQHRLK